MSTNFSNELSPTASSMILVLRSIGYTPESAISDLIDNSIFAKSKNIHIDLDWNSGNPKIAITDDGIGMSEDESNAEDWRGTNEGCKLAGYGTLWEDSGLEQNDEFGTSGFNAPGGGHMAPDGGVAQPRWHALYWTSTDYDSIDAWSRRLYFQKTEVKRDMNNKHDGYSCRCVKD